MLTIPRAILFWDCSVGVEWVFVGRVVYFLYFNMLTKNMRQPLDITPTQALAPCRKNIFLSHVTSVNAFCTNALWAGVFQSFRLYLPSSVLRSLAAGLVPARCTTPQRSFFYRLTLTPLEARWYFPLSRSYF